VVLVSPMVKALFPGFREYKVGMQAGVIVSFVGELLGVLENEVGDTITLDSTGSAVIALKMLSTEYHERCGIPTIEEIDSYEVARKGSTKASSLILRGS
jgi:hypothetical protein